MYHSVLCLICLCGRLLICALWSPAGKGLISCHFPIRILRQVWYLIVSNPDFCTLTYFNEFNAHLIHSQQIPLFYNTVLIVFYAEDGLAGVTKITYVLNAKTFGPSSSLPLSTKKKTLSKSDSLCRNFLDPRTLNTC